MNKDLRLGEITNLELIQKRFKEIDEELKHIISKLDKLDPTKAINIFAEKEILEILAKHYFLKGFFCEDIELFFRIEDNFKKLKNTLESSEVYGTMYDFKFILDNSISNNTLVAK